MSSSSRYEKKHTRAYPFAVVDSYRDFSFRHAIQFHPVELIVSMPHSK